MTTIVDTGATALAGPEVRIVDMRVKVNTPRAHLGLAPSIVPVSPVADRAEVDLRIITGTVNTSHPFHGSLESSTPTEDTLLHVMVAIQGADPTMGMVVDEALHLATKCIVGVGNM